jgi:hypothetical protein
LFRPPRLWIWRLAFLEELDDAPQGPGRLWVVHDWREGAVEIQTEGDLARPLGQLRCVLGDRGVDGHGVRFSETPCSWPGASSIVWTWTRTWIGWALPGRELSRTWASASSTSIRCPR